MRAQKTTKRYRSLKKEKPKQICLRKPIAKQTKKEKERKEEDEDYKYI